MFLRHLRKPLWVVLGIVLVICIAAVWAGAEWRPQPVPVERDLPEDGFSY